MGMSGVKDSRVRVTTYTVVPTGYDDMVMTGKSVWALTVTDGLSEHGWAVRHLGNCLSREGEWEYEPIPSMRDDEWLAAHRFPLEEALARALAVVDDVVLNGRTARQADAVVRAQHPLS